MKRALLFLALVLTATAQAQTNPVSGAAAVEEGRTLYNNSCTGCHGANGAAGEIGPGLAVPGRSYARTSDAQMFDAIKHGIPATLMPAHDRKLSDDQIWKITAYVKGLRGTAIDAPSPGDAARGEQVFWGAGQCGSCHMVGGKGSVIGPDLSTIASLRKTSSLIAALTQAQHRVYGAGGAQPHTLPLEPMYPVVRVTTADGRTIRGVLRNQDSFSIQMIGLDQKLYLFDRARLKAVVRESGSLMPTDYDKRLDKTEFGDLLAYLTRLGGPATPIPAPVRVPGKDPD